jgi:xanthine dehydrogenase accessory factor
MPEEIDSCSVAHGAAPAASTATSTSATATSPSAGFLAPDRTLIAVFSSPVAAYLLRYGSDAGYRPLLVEPDPDRASGAAMSGFGVLGVVPDDIEGADVVVTDHHREELGEVLREALATKARWIGVMGNPRHPAPHIPALEALGVAPGDIARVHRPIGLNIGSRTPPEIAISTLAGLLADRNSRPGGFTF